MLVVFVFAAMLGIVPAALVGFSGGPLWLMIVAYTVGGAVSILSVAAIAMLRPLTDAERALLDLGHASDWARADGKAPGFDPYPAGSPSATSRRTPVSAQITHLSTARMIGAATRPGNRSMQSPTDDIYRWPDEMPEDLRLRLLDAMTYEAVGPADIWDEVQDWLVESKVPCPLTVRAAHSTTRA